MQSVNENCVGCVYYPLNLPANAYSDGRVLGRSNLEFCQ